MVFCGQCGLHLPAGVTRCPRCGTVANTPSDESGDQFSTDAPTVASLTYIQSPQANSYAAGDARAASIFEPRDQQKLVLNPQNNRSGFNSAVENEPTSAMNQADYRTRPQVPVDYNTNSPYSTAPSQTPYPSQPGGTFSNSSYPRTHAPSTAVLPPERKTRRWPLLFAVLLILIVVSASGVFVLQRLHSRQTTGGNSTVTTTVVSPIDTAKRVVQDYYDEVNNKDYQAAYNRWQWGTNAPTYTTFKNGYANTVHDTLTIQSATRLSDGTVKVFLTIVATEHTSSGSGTQQHTYTGYYIVGQRNGTWKILYGTLNLVH